ncbi:hypothetical protein EGR_07271 [Echinococcus granulosus]|uniref:Uncharacterized protein n=1 Tax=Echinococcus granulosus TaxID=6210 RepID=W6UWP3_ECHGR|nr:hypothetical protein EGR_07271 [Echinococcus granulosus]EUB57909.1 hypothetical protein EGR_07271 [Echinococcus granulosus]
MSRALVTVVFAVLFVVSIAVPASEAVVLCEDDFPADYCEDFCNQAVSREDYMAAQKKREIDPIIYSARFSNF